MEFYTASPVTLWMDPVMFLALCDNESLSECCCSVDWLIKTMFITVILINIKKLGHQHCECRNHALLTLCQQTKICLHVTRWSEEPHYCYNWHNAPLLSCLLCESLNGGRIFSNDKFLERDAQHISITLHVIIVLIIENKWDLLLNINTSITNPINCTLCLHHFRRAKSFQFCQNPLLQW